MQLLFFYYKKQCKKIRNVFQECFRFPFLHISTVFYRPLFKQTLAWLFSFTFIQGRALLCRCAPSGLPVPFTVHVNVRGMPGMCPQPTSCVESKRQSITVCTLLTYAFMCSTMVVLRKPIASPARMQH